MVYTSLEFFILYPLTLVLFLSVRTQRLRFLVLTVASLIFYAWAGFFDFGVFLFVVAVSFAAASLANRQSSRRKLWVAVGVAVLVGHLIFWKYVPWIADNLQQIFPGLHGGHRVYLPLPIGISFFTFQGIAFLIDLGRGDAEMMSFREYLLFKSFFSQLIAGPIVRARELVPQLRSLKTPAHADLAEGAALFTMGLFKKLIIADHLSLFVSGVFAAPQKFDRSTLVWAMLAFTAQDWADFSGYTDMGRGTARMLGIRLPENFLSPGLARTPIEVWKRWHITLSQWMRDYVFFPLTRSLPLKNRLWRSVIAALLTFLLVGIWHGANWIFVFWGLYVAALFLLELILGRSAIGRAWNRLIPAAIRTPVLTTLTFASTVLGLTLYRSADFGRFRVFLQSLWEGGDKVSLLGSTHAVYWSFFFAAMFQFVFYYSFVKESWPALDFAKAALKRMESVFGLPPVAGNPIYLKLLGAFAGIAVGLVMAASIAYRQYESFASFIYFQF